MGGMFRAEILRRLRGYDTGLGDDTDMTRWSASSNGSWVFRSMPWSARPFPRPRHHLWSQRMRWSRNSVKIRISKHRDQFMLGRYGFANAVLSVQLLLRRLLLPPVTLIGLFWVTLQNGPLDVPQILVTFLWIVLFFLLIRMLIARDICKTPQPVHFWLVFFDPFYNLWLLGPLLYAQSSELFRIGTKHPYVPDHVWQEIPWW